MLFECCQYLHNIRMRGNANQGASLFDETRHRPFEKLIVTGSRLGVHVEGLLIPQGKFRRKIFFDNNFSPGQLFLCTVGDTESALPQHTTNEISPYTAPDRQRCAAVDRLIRFYFRNKRIIKG